MSLEKPRPRARRSIEAEEARAWVGFYRRAGADPEIAAEILAQLESDPEMKRAHLALYLRCRESLGRDQARQARNQRIGQFVRWLGHAVLIRPFAGLRRSLRHGADMAVACLPPAVEEPAQARPVRGGACGAWTLKPALSAPPRQPDTFSARLHPIRRIAQATLRHTGMKGQHR